MIAATVSGEADMYSRQTAMLGNWIYEGKGHQTAFNFWALLEHFPNPGNPCGTSPTGVSGKNQDMG